jgi:hypothetical protein
MLIGPLFQKRPHLEHIVVLNPAIRRWDDAWSHVMLDIIGVRPKQRSDPAKQSPS